MIERKVKLASRQECTGCLACVDACNHSALNVIKQGELLYPSIDSDLCIDCNLCQKACPVVSPVQLNKVEEIRVAGGWAIDEYLRVNGASGGAFAGIAKTFFYMYQGCTSVYGARLENNRVHHQRIDKFEDIALLMNSKYIQSDTRGIFNQVRDDLRDGLYVLFSGTPCQIAGLYGFLGKKRDSEKLLTVELICAGVLSPEALDIHLASFNSSKIISFRNKVEGQNYSKSQCTTIDIEGKPFRFTKRNEDVFYRCFSSSILERKSCFNCQFAKLERVADITIGDFWGGNKDFHEYEKGVNVILTNNLKARDFVRSSEDLELYSSTIGKAISGNPCLYSNYNFIKFHPLVLWPNASRKLLPRKIWLQIVKNDNPWRYLWGAFRLLSILYTKRELRKIKAKYSTLLDEWWGGQNIKIS